MNRLLEFFKTFLKKRLLLLILLGTTGVVLSVIFGSFLIKSLTKPKRLADSLVTASQELSIVVPDGAYNKVRSFQIRRISSSEFNPSLASIFVSNVYNVAPSDGINEFAMTPITIRYRLPSNLYLGDEYANVSIAYVPNPKEPIYRVYGGAYVQMDQAGAYIEAQVFHTSMIGLIAHVPEKQKVGLQLISEKAKSIEPVLLLIPDIDRNFLGSITPGSAQQINFWAELFPNRTMMYYEYPIVATKSKAYMDSFTAFSRMNAINSYLFYEASRLAAELLRLSNLEFDIVAHGIGGIIARLAVEKYPQVKNVRKIVLVSTPSGGTNIVNPVYFGSFFYEKPSETVAKNFGTEKSVVDAAKTHILFYLESLGPIYREIIQSGVAINLLEKPRKEIGYLTVMGDRPPMSINFSGTLLEKFYPELASGDGIVTKEAVQIEGVELFVVPGSFFDCYLSPQFQSKIKDFLRYEIPKITEYRRDSYPERSPQAQVTEKITTKTSQPQQERQVVNIPTKYTNASLATIKERISASDVLNLYQIGSSVVYHRPNALYIGQNKFFTGEVKYVHSVGGKLGFISGSKAFLYDGASIKELGLIYQPERCLDILISETGMYALTKVDKINLLKWNNKWELLKQFDGEYAKFLDGNEPFALTNLEVYRITGNNVQLVMRASDIGLKERSIDLTCFYELGNFIFLGTRAYSLILYNKSDRTYKIVGEGWINPERIFSSKDWVIILGKSTIMFYDVKNMSFRSEIQRLEGEARGAALVGNNLYVLIDNRIDLLNLP